MAAISSTNDGDFRIEHSPEYRRRRFMNWFPLGLTYATFYMGRYNINVVAKTLQETFGIDNTQFGVILTAGFWVYALSVMFNGPLADKLGGKKAILFGSLGAAIMNMIIGLVLLSGWLMQSDPLGPLGSIATSIINGFNSISGRALLTPDKAQALFVMAVLYAMNSYFQSFGALSVVKVNAPWFHVRERGVFGGIFGIMISSGYLLAFSVGGLILSYLPWYYVFIVPSIILMVMFTVDLFIVKETPQEAGFKDFNTGDASSGDDTPINWNYLFKQILSNPIIITLAFAEFCTGFVRQGLLAYFSRFLEQVHHVIPKSPTAVWAGLGITIGGILGGLLCGFLSDRVFQSRRPPVAFIFYMAQIVALLMLGWVSMPAMAAALVGFSCMWIFGVHGMLSGTASADFGGKKAAATVTGLLDGVQYVASGFTGFGLGLIIDKYGWGVWTYTIIPFSIIGGILMLTIWNAKPQKKGAGGH
ncbi:MAG: MFS transporter [Acidobacteria bacterium]|nr:MFS transporter [Acidobacteriota bacterium]